MNEKLRSRINRILPYVLIITGFVVIAYAYAPYVLQGKIVNGGDSSSWRGMAHEIVTHNRQHPDDKALWTNSMFGGMPATQVSVNYEGDVTEPLYNLLFLGKRPSSYLLISLIGGFLLFLAFGMNPWLSALGAFAITFCSYNMEIIQVGHNSKMVAVAFMPWVLAAVVHAYRKKPLTGALFFAFALTFQIKANHPQITYYLAIIIFGYAIAEMCGAIKGRYFPKWLKTSAMLLAAGLLGIATNANRLLPTYEFTEYTMRGGSELTHDKDNQTGSGLKLDYATAWSYGIEETPNLLIPNFNGGASAGELSKNSNTYKLLRANYRNANTLIKQMPLYWGPQPFTAGPMYMGAISIFLFVLGLFVIKGRHKWWIVAVSLLALFLSWGSHFIWFSKLFFKYAPLYNKFRTVSMILVILQITIPVLAILGLNEILYNVKDNKERKIIEKKTIIAAAITGGVCLLFAIFPGLAGDFSSSSDAMFGNANDLIDALRADRRALLVTDALTSFAYILIAFAIIYFTIKAKWKPALSVALLSAAVIVNMWSVDKRYLNSSHFVKERTFEKQFAERPVDRIIHQDPDPYYRVLDLSVNTFNDAMVSYHHKTIGGYSPVKLRRYQDMIDHHISKEMSQIARDINAAAPTAGSIAELEEALGYYPVLSMLNMKYIVIDGNSAPLRYDKALGNAWFVSASVTAPAADDEMEYMSAIDPARHAVVFDPTAAKGVERNYDASGFVALTRYSPNRLDYKASSPAGGLAVFSEIYYPAGWKAFIDGKEAEILRVDYLLRGLNVEAGEHEITFIYNPASFSIGKNISTASSVAIILLSILYILAVSVRFFKSRKRKLSA